MPKKPNAATSTRRTFIKAASVAALAVPVAPTILAAADKSGKMKTPHGLWLDDRPSRKPSIVVADRANARLQYFSLDGKHLGYDAAWTKKVLDGFKVRRDRKAWQDGRFVHPHDACFDKTGNIYVAEWVLTGRVSFLRNVS